MTGEVDKHRLECRADETVRHTDQKRGKIEEIHGFKEYKAGESHDHEQDAHQDRLHQPPPVHLPCRQQAGSNKPESHDHEKEAGARRDMYFLFPVDGDVSRHDAIDKGEKGDVDTCRDAFHEKETV